MNKKDWKALNTHSYQQYTRLFCSIRERTKIKRLIVIFTAPSVRVI